MAGEVKHKDVGPELTYDEYHASDSHTIDGVEAGTVIAGKTTLAEVKADTDIADAISKKHSNTLDHANTLDHTQGTDQGLDTGGLNAVTAAEVKGAVTNSHAPGSDDQVIPTQLSDLSDDENHRLVTDTEKGTWNGKATVADVKADEDVASAISNSHASGSDNQDLSGLVPYSGATGDVALGTHSLGCAGVSATGNVVGKTIIGDDLILWDTGETLGDPTISMVSGDVGNSLTLSTDGTVAEIVSNNKMFHFRTGENIIRFIKSLYEYWFTIDLTGANPQLTSYTGEISFDNENLTTTGNITAATLKATNLSDGKIPYHVDDANGLADGPTKTDVDSAVSLKHAAVTVSAPIALSGQALSLVNNAGSPATITTISTDGTLAGNSDVYIPTQKAVKTYADSLCILRGTATLANARLSLVDGTAFFDFGVASLMTSLLGGKLTITDSAGKKAIGYIKAAGTGETYGDELVTNGGFASDTTGWVASSANLSSVAGGQAGNCLQIEKTGAGSGYAYQNIATAPALSCFKSTAYHKNGTATAKILIQAPAPAYATSLLVSSTYNDANWSQKTNYVTSLVDAGIRVYVSAYSGTTGDTSLWDTISLKQVLTPSATGVTITSTAGGTTYNWTSIEAGFNYNDASGYSYYISPSTF